RHMMRHGGLFDLMPEPALVGMIGGITDDLGDVRRNLGMRRMPTYLAIRGDRRYRWREAPLAVRPPAVVFAFPRLTRKPLSTLFCWCRQFLSSLQRGLVALSMKLGEYQDLYRKLGTVQDIDFLAENFGYDKELLLVVYTQRIVRDTTKKFYRVKAQARRLAFMWQNGTSLLEIARRFDFPPILTALMVLEQRRISRSTRTFSVTALSYTSSASWTISGTLFRRASTSSARRSSRHRRFPSRPRPSVRPASRIGPLFPTRSISLSERARKRLSLPSPSTRKWPKRKSSASGCRVRKTAKSSALPTNFSGRPESA